MARRRLRSDFGSFLASFSEELDAQSRRVRQLIGDKHWGHDGSWKELVLADALRPHVGDHLKISRGFVLDSGTGAISREQDLLFVRTNKERPIFESRDSCVAAPATVGAVISVKTTFARDEFFDAVDSVVSAKQIAFNSIEECPYGAVFFFEEPSKGIRSRAVGWLKERSEDLSLLPDLVCSIGQFVLHTRPSEKVVVQYEYDSPYALAALMADLRALAPDAQTTAFAALVDLVHPTSVKRFAWPTLAELAGC